MVVQAAIGNEENPAARKLAIDDPAYVDTRLADEIASELDDDARLRQVLLDPRHERREPASRRAQVERLVAGEVGDAEAAARIEAARRRGRVRCEAQRELDRLLLRLADRGGAKVLRAAENVKAPEVERQPGEPREHVRNALGIDAERLRSSAHAHARALQLEIGIDPDRYRGARPGPPADEREPLHLALRPESHDDARGHRAREPGVGLAGPGEADGGGLDAACEGDLDLAGGGDVDAGDLRC